MIDQLYVLPAGAVSADETVVETFAHCDGVPTVIEPDGVVKIVTRLFNVTAAEAHVGAAGFVSVTVMSYDEPPCEPPAGNVIVA